VLATEGAPLEPERKAAYPVQPNLGEHI
jgi:hypothetical protein